MTEELLAKRIKDEILVSGINRYFDILAESDHKPFKNHSWRKAQLLYNSIDESNRENLKEFIKMTMLESVSGLLSYIDGIASFEGQEYPLELYHHETHVSGSLQEYLLMDIEMNGL